MVLWEHDVLLAFPLGSLSPRLRCAQEHVFLGPREPALLLVPST